MLSAQRIIPKQNLKAPLFYPCDITTDRIPFLACTDHCYSDQTRGISRRGLQTWCKYTGWAGQRWWGRGKGAGSATITEAAIDDGNEDDGT